MVILGTFRRISGLFQVRFRACKPVPTENPRPDKVAVLLDFKAQGLAVVSEGVLGFTALSLSLLDEFSDAFLATRAAIIAGHPANETTTGTAINQHPTFTNLFIFLSLLKTTTHRPAIRRTMTLARCWSAWAGELGAIKGVSGVQRAKKEATLGNLLI